LSHRDESHIPDDLEPTARRLGRERPELSPIELDQIKTRLMSRRGGRARGSLRGRILVAAIALGLMGAGAGGVMAGSGTPSNPTPAASSQYANEHCHTDQAGNTKGCSCPDHSVLTSNGHGTVCTCPGGSTVNNNGNSCQCPASAPQFDNKSDTCVPKGTQGGGSPPPPNPNKNCNTDQAGNVKQCNCPDHSILTQSGSGSSSSNFSCTCPDHSTLSANGNSCQCPSNMPHFNDKTDTCEAQQGGGGGGGHNPPPQCQHNCGSGVDNSQCHDHCGASPDPLCHDHCTPPQDSSCKDHCTHASVNIGNAYAWVETRRSAFRPAASSRAGASSRGVRSARGGSPGAYLA
jgi:hypothetical protein